MRIARTASIAAFAIPFVALGALVVACSKHSDSPAPETDAGACTSPDFAGAPLGVRCNALVDESGRTVLLHGVNARVQGVFDVTFDDGRTALEPIPTFGEEDARRIRRAGFNALRLPINWSAIEPTESGGFDEAYLGKVGAVVDACRAANVYVMLDLHQDAYSKEIGEDGAPLWAIVPPPTQKLEGPLTDLAARRLSRQVSDAFDTFFGTSPDGERLRGRYATMAAHVMERWKDDAAVVGLEVFNEPLAKTDALVAFYKQVLDAVHAVAPRKLVFFEPSSERNVIDVGPIGNGPIGPGAVYAPHVYTQTFTGTDATRAAITKDKLVRSNDSARAEADGYGSPLVVGEFGWDPHAANFADYVRWQFELQDTERASSFLWVWKELSQGGWGFYDFDAANPDAPPTERPAVFAAMQRVRLEAASGTLLQVGYDHDARRFELHVRGDASITAPNVVSIGGTFADYDATCDGASVAHDGADPVSLACGGAGEHVLVIQGK